MKKGRTPQAEEKRTPPGVFFMCEKWERAERREGKEERGIIGDRRMGERERSLRK